MFCVGLVVRTGAWPTSKTAILLWPKLESCMGHGTVFFFLIGGIIFMAFIVSFTVINHILTWETSYFELIHIVFQIFQSDRTANTSNLIPKLLRHHSQIAGTIKVYLISSSRNYKPLNKDNSARHWEVHRAQREDKLVKKLGGQLFTCSIFDKFF